LKHCSTLMSRKRAQRVEQHAHPHTTSQRRIHVQRLERAAFDHPFDLRDEMAHSSHADRVDHPQSRRIFSLIDDDVGELDVAMEEPCRGELRQEPAERRRPTQQKALIRRLPTPERREDLPRRPPGCEFELQINDRPTSSTPKPPTTMAARCRHARPLQPVRSPNLPLRLGDPQNQLQRHRPANDPALQGPRQLPRPLDQPHAARAIPLQALNCMIRLPRHASTISPNAV
jgi:hypothetical protein